VKDGPLPACGLGLLGRCSVLEADNDPLLSFRWGFKGEGGAARGFWYCEPLGGGARRAFLSKTRRFCSSSGGVADIGGRTGLEKFDVIGLAIGVLPARVVYSGFTIASLGDETITVGTGELGDEGKGGC
jgi:hypothetical protein